MTFELSRPDSMAIREFVPGNLLYANGGKYKVGWYHLSFGEHRIQPDSYLIDSETKEIFEIDQAVTAIDLGGKFSTPQIDPQTELLWSKPRKN